MKRLILFLMAGILMIAGCTDSGHSQFVSESTARVLPPADPVKTYDDSLIGEAWSMDGTLQQGNYHYRVPELLSDQPGAEAFNEHLLSMYGKDEFSGYISDYVCSLDWESRWYGSLLSLIMIQENWEGYISHYSYFFDFSRDQEMTASEVLNEYAGVSSDRFFRELEREAALCQDEITLFEPDYSEQGIAEMLLRRAETLAMAYDRNRYLLSIYLDEDGTIGAYLPVYSTGAGMWVEQECFPDMDWVCQAQEAEAGFIHASCRPDGIVEIWYSSEFGSRKPKALYGFEYNKKYEVEGCYGRYTDLVFQKDAPDSGIPYLFLLTKDHTVEYVDVFRCMKYGTYICGGPLYGHNDILSLEADPDDGRIYGVRQDGSRVDLADEIHPFSIPVSLAETWEDSWDLWSGSLSIDEDGNVQEHCSNHGQESSHEGRLERIGVSTEGLIYASSKENEPGYDSPVYGFQRSDLNSIFLTYLSGPDVFGLADYEGFFLTRDSEEPGGSVRDQAFFDALYDMDDSSFRDALAQNDQRSVDFSEPEEVIDGQTCRIVTVGEMRKDRWTVIEWYAVSTDSLQRIYHYDMDSDRWILISDGAYGMGGEAWKQNI